MTSGVDVDERAVRTGGRSGVDSGDAVASPGTAGHPIRVLLVEDDEDDYMATRALLDDAERITVDLAWASSIVRARELIETERFDVLLVDHHLGPSTGLEFVRTATQLGVRGPFILLTGVHDGRIDDDALSAGVADYLVKGHISPSRLERSIRHTLQQAQLVDELERARELKDQFLSHVSHELRTPIAAVQQFVSILLDGLAGDLGAEQRDYLEIVLRNAVQLAKMVNDLLDATRVRAGKLRMDPVRVPAATMIDAAAADHEQRAADAQVSLSTECSPDLVVRADPARTHQVLSNLLDNALRFTPAGGTIAISAEAGPDATAVLSVVDSGVGMDPADSEVIFKRHGQIDGPITGADSRRGLGLGLFICRQLVEQQGGRIWVDSAIGAGSAFHFTLPLWSLAGVVGPAVERMVETDGRLAVIRTRITDDGREPCDGDRGLLALARRTIDDFTLPYDVIVPPADDADRAVYLLAPVDERNVAALTTRISGELARRLRPPDVAAPSALSVSSLVLPDVEAASADDLCAAVAAHVEGLIDAPDDRQWSPAERNTDGKPQGTDR